MNVVTEMSMPLWPAEYKRLVSGVDCMVEAKKAVKELLERTMDEALEERLTETRRRYGESYDRRNGSYERSLLTSFGYLERIRVPRARVTSIADVVLPKYSRTQPEFDAAVVHSYLLGHSTRKSKRFFTEFLGELGVSHTKVSRILARLDERCQAWRRRPLNEEFVYLWLDGKYARIQGADKRPYAVLFAYGATESGKRELLGFQIHRGENSGCDQAVLSILGDVAQQACAVHLERNIADMVAREHRAAFQPELSEVFKQPSASRARRCLTELFSRWETVEPKACAALRGRADRSLVFYEVAANARWRSHLKSTNMLERFFRELKRFEKSRQFRFANKRSCERFYYAFAYDYNQRYQRMPDPPLTQKG